MDYLRKIDFSALKAAPAERINQVLIDTLSGGDQCGVAAVQTPVGGGSPAGLHRHVFDQYFYMVSGVMDFEIEGKQYKAGPGELVVFPTGVPHRNWNGGAEPTLHLNFMIPCPKPGEPIGIPV